MLLLIDPEFLLVTLHNILVGLICDLDIILFAYLLLVLEEELFPLLDGLLELVDLAALLHIGSEAVLVGQVLHNGKSALDRTHETLLIICFPITHLIIIKVVQVELGGIRATELYLHQVISQMVRPSSILH